MTGRIEPVWRNTTAVGFSSAATAASNLLFAGILAYQFGASGLTDAFFIAQILPLLLVKRLQIGPLTRLLLPAAAEGSDSHQDHRVQTARLAGQIVTSLLVLFAGLVLLVEGLVPWIIKALAPGFTAGAQQTGTRLAQLLLPTVLFSLLSESMVIVLQGAGRFRSVAWIEGTAIWVRPMVLWLLAVPFGIWAAVAATWVWNIVRVIALGWLARREGFRLTEKPALGDPRLKQFGRTMIPLGIRGLVGELHLILIRILASYLPAGSVSLLSYGQRLFDGIGQFVVTAPATVLYPQLVRLVREPQAFLRRLWEGVRVTHFIIFPIGMIAILLAEPLVRLLFERGAFGPDSTRETTQLFQLMMAGFFFQGFSVLFLRALYALQKTGEILKAVLLQQAMTAALAWLSFNQWGLSGLALAWGLTQFFAALFYGGSLAKIFPGAFGGWRLPISHFGKFLTALGISAALCIMMRLLIDQTYWTLGIGGLSLMGYGAAAWLLRLAEARRFIEELTQG